MIVRKKVIALFIVLLMSLTSWSVSTDEIADKALEYEGTTFSTWQDGECKGFVRNAVRWAGGPTIRSGYKICFEVAGREITSSEAVRGDIIQISSNANPETDDSATHTAIVLTNYGNGNFKVIDSNYVDHWTVGTHNNWNPSTWAATGFSPHFYRLGTVSKTVANFTPIKFIGLNSSTVYLLSNKQLWPIPNPKIYCLLGFGRISNFNIPNWSYIIELSKSSRDNYEIRDKALIGADNQRTTYRVQGRIGPNTRTSRTVSGNNLYQLGQDRKMHHIDNWNLYLQLGYDSSSKDITDITQDLFNYFGEGVPIKSIDSGSGGDSDFVIAGGSDPTPIPASSPTPIPPPPPPAGSPEVYTSRDQGNSFWTQYKGFPDDDNYGVSISVYKGDQFIKTVVENERGNYAGVKRVYNDGWEFGSDYYLVAMVMPGSSHITYSDYFSVGNFSNMPTPLPGNPLDPTPTPAPADLEISDIQLLSHTPEQGKITVQWQSNIVPEKFVVQIWVGATGIEAYKIGGDGIEVDGNKNSLVINAEDLGGISGWYTPLIRGIDGDWVYGKTTEVSALISLPTSTPTVTPTPTITPTLTPTNVPVSLKPTAVVPPPTATPIVVLTPTATPKPVKIPASTLFRYDGNGYTGYGPVSGGQATNWLFQLNRKSNVFNQGDTVYGMIRINEVTANFRFRVITYRNGAEAYDWSGGWTNVGHGWPYAHHWMNWDNIWSGNWEFHIYVDVGNDWNKIEVLSFTVH